MASTPLLTLGVISESSLNILIIITVVYVLAVGYLGFRGWQASKTTTDYLLAGRNANPYVMAISYGATFISTSAIVGFGGAAAQLGMGLLWLTFLNIFAGILIAFIFLGKRTRRMGLNLDAHTFPEFLGRRFQSRFIQVFAGLVIFTLMPLYTAAVLRGGAEFIKETFGISIIVAVFIFSLIVAAYVLAGGLKGVMLVDALQGGIMFLGMFILITMTYVKLGGFTTAHQALTDLAGEVPAGLAAAGHRGWTAMPEFPSPIWFTMVTTLVLGVGIGVLAQPQLAVRFMTVRSGRQLNRAVLVGGVFILMMTGVAFVVGPLSNVYFFQTEGQIAITVAGGNVDEIIPKYINAALPQWFVAVFMLTLLCAAMSTLSSQFHTMGTSIGRDVCEQGLIKSGSHERSVLITRSGIIVAFVITLWLSLALPPSIIASATAVFFGVCAVAFLPMYVGCLYTRRITRAGAIAGMVSGFAIAMFWLLFLHGTNAGRLGLCEWLTGRKTLLAYPWASLDPLVIALPVSVIITVVVSMFTKPLPTGHLDECFNRAVATPSPPVIPPAPVGSEAN